MKKIFRDLLKELDEFNETAEGRGFDLRLDLADIIFRHLAEKGWTQTKLAEAAGMKSPLLTRIMHSSTNCTFETAGRILLALGIKGKLVEADFAKSLYDMQSKAATSFGYKMQRIEDTRHEKEKIRQYNSASFACFSEYTDACTIKENNRSKSSQSSATGYVTRNIA